MKIHVASPQLPTLMFVGPRKGVEMKVHLLKTEFLELY